jgi:hypothetical protein
MIKMKEFLLGEVLVVVLGLGNGEMMIKTRTGDKNAKEHRQERYSI